MRVANYTQQTAATHGSVFALIVLVTTLLMGTGVVPSIVVYVGGPLERLLTPIWLLLYLSSLGGLMFTQGINWISWLVRYRILLVVLILGTILSVSWSIDAQVSAERTVHLTGSTLVAIFIGFSVPLQTILRVFAVVLGGAILASIGAALALPELGIQSYEGAEVWRGVFTSKNDLGFWAAAGVLLYIALSDSLRAHAVKLLCFLMTGLCLATLAFSQSATSLLALIIASVLSLYLFIAGRFQLGFIRMVMLAVLFMGVIGMAITNIDTAELVGRSGDLTGRGEVWQQVWKLILEKPLTGVGYGSLWFPTDDTLWIQQSLTDFTWVVYHAHNGLLQIASEVGMPLAVIALLMVAQQLIEIVYCQYQRQQAGVLFVLAFVAAYLVSNYSEARFLVTRELFWIFFIALPISMLRQINLLPSDPEGFEASRDDSLAVINHRAGSVYGTAMQHGVAHTKPWISGEQRPLFIHGLGDEQTPEGIAAGSDEALTVQVSGKRDADDIVEGMVDSLKAGVESEIDSSVFEDTWQDKLIGDEIDIDLGRGDKSDSLLLPVRSAELSQDGQLEQNVVDGDVRVPTDTDGRSSNGSVRAVQTGEVQPANTSRASVRGEKSTGGDRSDELPGNDRYDKPIDLSDDEWDELDPPGDR